MDEARADRAAALRLLEVDASDGYNWPAMNLYIAEKPSLGRAIADVLPRPHQRGDGFIRVGNGDCVSWCIGHLLEQAEPHAYDPAFKSWRFEHLPIVPEKWQLTPKSDTKKQLSVLRKLVSEATTLVHAGDPDREGQLLVDQVIAYLRVSAERRRAIKRLLINDLNPSAVERALSRLESNQDFRALSTSALARSRADWLYGINMTRAYTIAGRKVGYDGVLSVGRVQTPVLGLVVRRCDEIENFVSQPFFEVLAHLLTDQGESFVANWQPSEACQPYMDESNRVLVKALAESVVKRITDKPALVEKYEQKTKKQNQPLPYSLSALQIDAGKRFGMSAQQTLSACQSLYEKHRLITYPRSDCRYLPREHHAQASGVINAIAQNEKTLASAAQKADASICTAAWNDARVEAHHAIIPTLRKQSTDTLTSHERQVYQLVSRQYLAQFYPVHQYLDTRAEIVIEGGRFVASAKKVTQPGWKVLFGADKQKQPEPLPALAKGQSLHCERGELVEKNTTPPPYFTDATLLAAMTGISRYVTSAELRKVLKETDGLGTEATRAGIIELLFRRGFLQRKGKAIHATDAGRGLVRSLPQEATAPDMTAHWESTLNAISKNDARYEDFMRPLETSLRELVQSSAANQPVALKGVAAPARAATGKKRRARKKTAAKKTAAKRKTVKKKTAGRGRD